ncbi:MAG: lysophospholipid acyltransferase family protein [Acidobacteriota bacterium]|nr:lysophospholipid acyltransferase family protein [Acidobacteriota bacterium]
MSHFLREFARRIGVGVKTAYFYVMGVAWVTICAYGLVIPIAIVERVLCMDRFDLAQTVLYYGTWLAGLPMRLVSRFHVDKAKIAQEGDVVVICNHHSYIDIFLLLTIFPRIHFTARSTLFRIPFLGWAMRLLGHVPHDPLSLDRGVGSARQWLTRGRYLGLFPEGTRHPEGEIGPFRRGAFRIAQDARVQVQPVVGVGTGRIWKRGQFWVRHLGPVGVRVLDPVNVPAGLSRSQFAEWVETVRQSMLRVHGQLREELKLNEEC